LVTSPGWKRAGRGASEDELRREAERHPGLLARVAAAALMRDVIAQTATLDERFAPNGSTRLAALEPRDRTLVRSIVTAGLRRLGSLRLALSQLLESGLPRHAGGLEWTLLVGATQILFLNVPDHAAVDLAVRAARLDRATAPFAGLVNAVLRNLSRRAEEFRAGGDPLDHDTPAWLAARWRKTYGEATARAIAAANRCEPTLDLTVKSDAAGWAARLDALLLPTGSLRLRNHQPIVELPGYEAGAWWVQDAAAACPARFVEATAGQHVADFCAAPGGKAAQLAATGATVTAIDRSAERLKRLAGNFERLDLKAEMLVADATTLKGRSFDAILVDAPCSATGTIRRHPDVAWAKKPGDITAFAALQARMLDTAASLVRPGGTIVFCTCSIEPEEGEMQIASLLRRNPDVERRPIVAADVGGLAELVTEQGDLRTLPSHLPDAEPRLAGFDGFFASRLLRRG
jgi:16S rRNA (cytosine967-C5)-methyltransferase